MPKALRVVLALACLAAAVAVPLFGHRYAEARPNQSKPRVLAILSYLAAPLLLGGAVAALRGKTGLAATPAPTQATTFESRGARLAGAVGCGAAAIGLFVGVDWYKVSGVARGERPVPE